MPLVNSKAVLSRWKSRDATDFDTSSTS